MLSYDPRSSKPGPIKRTRFLILNILKICYNVAMDNEFPQTENFSTLPSEPKKTKSRKFKVIVVIIIILALAGIAYYFKDLFIAATVDRQPVSRFAVIGELEKQSGASVLGALIDQRLIDKEIKKHGVTVDNQLVATEISNIETQITAQGGTLEA